MIREGKMTGLTLDELACRIKQQEKNLAAALLRGDLKQNEYDGGIRLLREWSEFAQLYHKAIKEIKDAQEKI